MSTHLQLPGAHPSTEEITVFSVDVTDTLFLSLSWELRGECLCVCLLDITSHLGRETAAQMFREAPMCCLGAEHLACTEVSQPPLVQMWVFITSIIVSLLQIALSAASLQKTFLYLIQCIVYHNGGQKAPWHSQKNNVV